MNLLASGCSRSTRRGRLGMAQVRWPTANVPEVMHAGTALRALIREYLFHLALPGMRRISREREREPPVRHGTRQ